MAKYFISHSEKDKEYADKFVDFLRLGFEINRKDIFCSSYSGCNITKGEDFVKYIKEKLDNTNIVFALISYNFIESAFCIAELGASWNAEKNVLPILLDENIKYSQITALFEHISTSKVTDKNDLMDIAEVLKKDNSDINIPNLNSKLDKFITDIIMLQGETKEPSVIDYAEYKKKEEENKKLKEIINSLKSTIKEKDTEIAEIKTLKDKQELKKYEIEKNKDFIEEFKQKCQNFTHLLSNYPKFVQYMIYKYACGESITYREVHDKCLDNEANDALEKKLIEDTGSGYFLNHTSIKTKAILDELENFKAYTANLPSDVENYVNDNFGLEIDITDKDFWNECFNRYFGY